MSKKAGTVKNHVPKEYFYSNEGFIIERALTKECFSVPLTSSLKEYMKATSADKEIKHEIIGGYIYFN